jgi:hypothetical protein
VCNAGDYRVVLGGWDDLLGDGAETANEWDVLSPSMQEFIERLA